ncbi:unnamed protein product, partial [Laminaria digitata]
GKEGSEAGEGALREDGRLQAESQGAGPSRAGNVWSGGGHVGPGAGGGPAGHPRRGGGGRHPLRQLQRQQQQRRRPVRRRSR